jgi:hypothetical protein
MKIASENTYHPAAAKTEEENTSGSSDSKNRRHEELNQDIKRMIFH